MVKVVSNAVGLNAEEMSNMHIYVHEVNLGCLVLSSIELPQMTPWYKDYCTKYHWFRDKLETNQIQL